MAGGSSLPLRRGGRAYVTEPSCQEVHVVDLTSGEVVKSAEVPHATNEITGVTG